MQRCGTVASGHLHPVAIPLIGMIWVGLRYVADRFTSLAARGPIPPRARRTIPTRLPPNRRNPPPDTPLSGFAWLIRLMPPLLNLAAPPHPPATS